MPQAIVDPEELRRFAVNLKKFSGDARDRMIALNGQFLELGKSWRDQENRKFAEEFERHMRSLAHFVEVTDEYVPFLLRKAESIEQYLEQR
jgi:hypothetical protein